METVQSWVVAGLGVAFIPQIAKLNAPPSPVYRSFEKVKPTRTIAAIWKKDRQLTRFVTECLKHLEEAAKAYETNKV